jgi:DNA-binding transcriptional LysR family regulator
VAGDLQIGASSIPGEHLLPPLLAGFRKRYPSVQVHVRIADSGEIMDQLERGKVQVGLVGQKPASEHLECRPFATDRMTVVVPADHPWAKRRRATLKQLAGQPLILREPGSGLRHCFEKSLTRAGLTLGDFRVVLELGSNEMIKSAVLRGNGIAILSLLAARKEIDAGQLVAVSVRGLKCDRELYVAHDRRRALPGPARVFLHYLERVHDRVKQSP